MTDLVALEHHRTFSMASSRAKSLAIRHKMETVLRRNGDGWDVLAPVSPRERSAAREYDSEYDSGEDDNDYECDRERNLIADEMMEDQDAWARSDEDGWFYADG